MIVSLRGTNGSGKSTIIRSVMKMYEIVEPIRVPDRRKPIGYKLDIPTSLYIPGHYEIANGGIDTLKSLDEAYDLIRHHHDAGFNVLYEGKNRTDGATRLMKFDPCEVTIIIVDHPVHLCVESVRARGHAIKVETIEAIARKTTAQERIFTEAGYTVHRLGREDALSKCADIVASW